jgi:predicted nucleic acid-binding protein
VIAEPHPGRRYDICPKWPPKGGRARESTRHGHSRRGGLLRRDFAPKHGTGLADALIAATAQQTGAELVTLNAKHFPMLRNVTVPYKK